ncbi:E3 ubiquitin-protein ligase TRIM9-like [Haliotis rufescens]|uniref:E3 ubiquitin-protein ligase TRIM9-like n=1 Tax=Haliotis rufescens TaxID=6454 RepID=UPI00201F4E67|nr:E3 ubiquitin-protein ligase TRIM9-like [Haliotis rufescens]XP_046345980.2 E3 ubiquitin-protein ligase TRIM9-like [Haliotis rufescens]XP_046345981.2 E3 ubiquitin-protein ligase TRIM9-like [Haliotis rufescens]XP_046345982.2 E3 ubiquitin-protein ligase TRIM9-like [Haliotis rufescens]
MDEAMALDNDDQMERQLSCCVCLELFTDPVLLPCLHSLCRRCVERFTRDGPVTSQAFKCPECNSQVDLGTSGHASLKRNFPLSSMVAIYRQSQRKIKLSQSPRTLDHQSLPNQLITPNPGLPTAAPRHCLHATAPNQDLLATLPNQGQQTTLPNQGQQAILPNPMMQGAPPYQAQQTTLPNQVLPSTCSTCDIGRTSQAHVFCETCNIAFCKTCRGVYHPEEIGHTLKLMKEPLPPVQEKAEPHKCTLCDPASPTPSPARLRCLECQMTFCNSCLHAFHPTSITNPEHTLVDVQSAPVQTGNPPSDATERRSSEPTRDRGGSMSSVQSRVDVSVVSELAQFAVEFTCKTCQTTPPQTATVKCLDCSVYLCIGCVGQHQSQSPTHSLMDISLTPQKEETKRKSTKKKPAPKKSVNVQLKLIELMNIRADAMAELLHVLRDRRATLQRAAK